MSYISKRQTQLTVSTLDQTVEAEIPGAVDLVLEFLIEESERRGNSWFDSFGISTDKNGLHLNEGLHRYKSEFGAGTALYTQYQIEWAGPAEASP